MKKFIKITIFIIIISSLSSLITTYVIDKNYSILSTSKDVSDNVTKISNNYDQNSNSIYSNYFEVIYSVKEIYGKEVLSEMDKSKIKSMLQYQSGIKKLSFTDGSKKISIIYDSSQIKHSIYMSLVNINSSSINAVKQKLNEKSGTEQNMFSIGKSSDLLVKNKKIAVKQVEKNIKSVNPKGRYGNDDY